MSTYRVTDANGHEVVEGSQITDFRGDPATFVQVSRGPEYNGTSKVIVKDPCGNSHEYYERVFGLTVETIDDEPPCSFCLEASCRGACLG